MYESHYHAYQITSVTDSIQRMCNDYFVNLHNLYVYHMSVLTTSIYSTVKGLGTITIYITANDRQCPQLSYYR